jgi:hypothetical protein
MFQRRVIFIRLDPRRIWNQALNPFALELAFGRALRGLFGVMQSPTLSDSTLRTSKREWQNR